MIVGMWGEGGEISVPKGMSASENKDVLQAIHWKSEDHNEKIVKAVKCLSPRREPSSSRAKGIISE